MYLFETRVTESLAPCLRPYVIHVLNTYLVLFFSLKNILFYRNQQQIEILIEISII